MLELFLVISAGLALGSFISALTYRLPRSESIVWARSACPACHTALGPLDLVPLLSWLLLRGRCRHCTAPISPRYPLTELASALLLFLLYQQFGLTPLWAIVSLLGICLLASSLIDWRFQVLPDSLQLTAALLALPYHLFLHHSWPPYLWGAALGIAVGILLHFGYYWLRKRHGLGLGDVKSFAIAGLWLGWEWLHAYWMIAGLLGIITGLLWRFSGRGERFPFGPALAAALLTLVVLQHSDADYILFPWLQPAVTPADY